MSDLNEDLVSPEELGAPASPEEGLVTPTAAATQEPEILSSADLAEDNPDIVSERDLLGERPKWYEWMGQGAANVMGMAAQGVGHALAGAFTFAEPIMGEAWVDEKTDNIFEHAKQAKDYWSDLVVPKKFQETADFGEKVTMGATSLVGSLAMGGPQGAAMLGMAGGAADVGQRFIDAGESVEKAQLAAGIQGGSNALGMIIPGFGRTLSHTAAYAVGGGPVLGGAADALTAAITDSKPLKEMYRWDDPAQRTVELIGAGAVGAFTHRVSKYDRILMQMKHYENRLKNADQVETEALNKEIAKFLGYHGAPSARREAGNYRTNDSVTAQYWFDAFFSEALGQHKGDEGLAKAIREGRVEIPPDAWEVLKAMEGEDPMTGQKLTIGDARDVEPEHIKALRELADPDNKANYEFKEAETWDDAYQRLLTVLDPNMVADYSGMRLNSRAIDIIKKKGMTAAQAAEILFWVADNPHQKAAAKYLLDRALDSGATLSEIVVTRKIPTLTDRPNEAGNFKGDADFATIFRDVAKDENAKAVILHELTHSHNSYLLDKIRAVKESQDFSTPGNKALREAIPGYDRTISFIEFLRQKATQDHRTELLDHYGLSETHKGTKPSEDTRVDEFFAELNTAGNKNRRPLAELLAKITLTPEEIKKFLIPLDTATPNTFKVWANGIRPAGSGPRIATALDVALQNFYALNMFADAAQRTKAGVRRPGLESYVEAQKQAIKNLAAYLKGRPYQQFAMQEVFNYVHNANSLDEFLTLAGRVSDSPEWKQFLRDNGEALFSRSDLLYKLYKEMGDIYKDVPYELRKFLLDNEPSDLFIQRILKEARSTKGELSDDLDMNIFGLHVMNPVTIRQLLPDNFSGKVVKHIIDKSQKWTAIGDRLYLEIYQPFQAAMRQLNKHEKITLQDAISFYNRPEGRRILERKGLWYEDPAEAARAFGLNDKQKAAFEAHSTMAIRLWELLEQSFNKNPANMGKTLTRLPGFMPNFHIGAFKVFILSKGADGKEFVSDVVGFKTAWAAKKYAKWYERVPGNKVKRFGRGTKKTLYKLHEFSEMENPLIVQLQEGLGAYLQLKKLDDAAVNQIQQAQDEAMQGFVKSFQERSDVGGFLGQYGAMPSDTQGWMAKLKWHLFGASDVYNIYEKYARSVVENWKNSMFLANEWAPIMSVDNGYMIGRPHRGLFFIDDFPKLNRYLSKYAMNLVGKETNTLSFLDNAVMGSLSRMGLDPMVARHTIRQLRSGLAVVKLRINPANWAMNTIQQTHMVAWLQYSNSITGYKGNPLKHLNRLMGQDFKPDADLTAALQRARENRLFDPQLQIEITETKFQGPFKAIASNIEEFGRTNSFALAFLHFKDQFNGDTVKAYDAAALAMQQVMVNYDRNSRPLMYQTLGITGQALAPFAVFRNAYLGNTYLMMKNLVQNFGLDAAKPLITSQLLYWMAAGSLGIYGVQEYNLIADTWNELSPDDPLPRAEEIFFKMELGDLFMYGPMSVYATKMLPGVKDGAYIGPSGAAVAIDDAATLPLKQFVESIGAMASIGVKSAKAVVSRSSGPTAEDVYKAGRAFVPPVGQGLWDQLFRGQDSDVAFTTTSLTGAVRRKPEDEAAILLTGKQSIGETNQRIKERLLARKKKTEAKMIESLVKMGADYAEGLPTLLTFEEIEERVTNLGVQIDEFREKIARQVQERRTSSMEREATRAGSMTSEKQYERRKALGEP